MIACDGPDCETEWFHYNCVGITEDTIPNCTWFCNECKQKFGDV